ncbi:AraC family transcriptional regulator [Colwellia polaris]|jgi:AraC-like DNA-binding protein|uniref:AraC family transcriptional regulator n=1 Tax=Colwellia polaris TaxID=326537 RepID=UPI000A172083|nr:AraC family transcriptional regulator [Colwellia polaris]|tara:strand:+ start:21709 stop:22752 length:1044 start_codon:yes stop_codon:yes gene_type:complete
MNIKLTNNSDLFMQKEITMPFQTLVEFEKIAAYHDISVQTLHSHIGLPNKKREQSSRVALKYLEDAFSFLYESTNDELLHTALTPLAKGTTLFACKLGCQAKNLLSALCTIEEFYDLTLGPLKIRLKRKANKVQLCIYIDFNPAIKQVIIAEVYLMVFYRLICMLINKRIHIYKMFVPHAKPSYGEEYKLLYNNKLVFNSDFIGFEFDELHLHASIKAKYDQVAQYFQNPLQLIKLHLADSVTYAGKVQYLFMSMSMNELPSKEEVAKKLNLSIRTLHRKLILEGTCFQQLKDDYRYKLAAHYLTTTDLMVEEIAYKLNLCDASSFIHSFNKWSGKNPQCYRQENSK